MTVRLHLVVGGQSSGKSAWAEKTVLAATEEWLRPVIICPCIAFDDGMKQRIQAHQEARHERWLTVETFDITHVFDQIDPDVPVLVDAVDTWLSQRAYELGLDQADPTDEIARSRSLIDEASRFGELAKERIAPTVVIAGVPGMGLVPLGTETRRLVDLHGRITQALHPDLVTWVHAGRVIAQG
ncbi:bifunctional adenosylcobinamide kinase/adenosylcobinamide-phosphate guanylyltransferase [Stomatohabitans albus]|uniref:bifunctional adenosylcobinamide kinase/adenosylcobinamide-phosphate guanylyltransferase n=1 Tax=Stomatohabitans albus TaxID=3110766 RepID=UPI00300C5419